MQLNKLQAAVAVMVLGFGLAGCEGDDRFFA